MPRLLKIRATSTDAGAMSETSLTPPNEMTSPAAPENMFLDGDAPRLGSTPMTPPAALGGAGTPVSSDAATAPALPLVTPVLSDPSTPMQSGTDLSAPTSAAPSTPAPAVQASDPAPEVPVAEGAPSIPAPSLPTLPTVAPAATPTAGATSTDTASAPAAGDGEHPMAHLMGGADKVSEASRHAAELRAAKKAKAKRMKIGFAVGALVVSGVVGPPLWSWFSNALNEAGNTSTEAPAD